MIFLIKPQELAKFRCTSPATICRPVCGIVCGDICIPKCPLFG